MKLRSISNIQTNAKWSDPETKNNSFSARTQKPSQFWVSPEKQVNFDLHSRSKSIMIPPTQKPRYFDPDLKSKSFSTPTHNQVSFDPYTDIKSKPMPHTEIKFISTTPRSLTLKSGLFWPPTQQPSRFRGQFWLSLEKQVNFDLHSRSKSTMIPPTQKPRYFDPDLKSKSFSTPTHNQVSFDPYTDIKSKPMPHTEIKFISTTPRSLTLKSGLFWPPTQQPSRFRGQH